MYVYIYIYIYIHAKEHCSIGCDDECLDIGEIHRDHRRGATCDCTADFHATGVHTEIAGSNIL